MAAKKILAMQLIQANSPRSWLIGCAIACNLAFGPVVAQAADQKAGDVVITNVFDYHGKPAQVRVPSEIWAHQQKIDLRKEDPKLSVRGAVAALDKVVQQRYGNEYAGFQVAGVQLTTNLVSEDNTGVYYYLFSFVSPRASGKDVNRTVKHACVLMSGEVYILGED